MVRARRPEIIEVLRQRIARALATGALKPGDRLPSTRAMATELSADPRSVAAAYRSLAAEQLVELRLRSGVFVRADAPHARAALAPPPALLVDVLTRASMRGHSGPAVAQAVHDLVSARALRALVIATTADQGMGIARELREDFGLDASSALAEQVRTPKYERALRRAQLLVTTEAHAALLRSLAEQTGAAHIVVTIRSDLFETEWDLWKNEVAHVVVLDPRFRRIVRDFLRGSSIDPAAVRVHLATDDLSRIPDGAPTYVTQAARTHLGRTRIPGMLIPPTRLLDEPCVRALWSMIAAANLPARA
jgi:DNA-binding transcriptional regulator YhcF (GntR family)